MRGIIPLVLKADTDAAGEAKEKDMQALRVVLKESEMQDFSRARAACMNREFLIPLFRLFLKRA